MQVRSALMVSALLSTALPLTTPPALASDEVSLSGYVRAHAGMLLDDSDSYAILQNTLETSISYTGDFGGLKATPYVYLYPTDEDEILDYGVRQLYADLNFDDFDIRVGKQQIIWGKADGVFITDIVSPKDLSEFLLRDFEEIRQGVTALKADYYFGDYTLELVLIPVFTPTRTPKESSIWYPERDFPIPPTFDRTHEPVEMELDNGEVFAKFSAMSSFIDYELMGGYMWDDDPSMHVTRTVDMATRQLSGLTLAPVHHRISLGGGSFSTTALGFVFRGEGAYYHGKLHNTEDLTEPEGLVEKDYVHYLLGLDKTLAGIRLSGQFIQQVILQYHEDILADELTTTLTLMASADFLRETLRVELFSYIGLNNEDALLRAKVAYKVTDGLEALVGADFFIGTEGPFGQYDDNDMVYTKLKYSF